MQARRRFYVDPALQFPIIVALLVLVVGEGLFVGWGFSKAIAAAKDWDRPDQAAAFFQALGLTLVPLVLFNFAAGAWLSHKIAGPLVRLKRVMSEISRGNLEVEVSDRSGDLLHSYVAEMSRMQQTLKRLIYRDHAHAAEADQLLTQAREWLARRKELPEDARKELSTLIDGAKSRLSIVNAHFMKGRAETAPKEAEDR